MILFLADADAKHEVLPSELQTHCFEWLSTLELALLYATSTRMRALTVDYCRHAAVMSVTSPMCDERFTESHACTYEATDARGEPAPTAAGANARVRAEFPRAYKLGFRLVLEHARNLETLRVEQWRGLFTERPLLPIPKTTRGRRDTLRARAAANASPTYAAMCDALVRIIGANAATLRVALLPVEFVCTPIVVALCDCARLERFTDARVFGDYCARELTLEYERFVRTDEAAASILLDADENKSGAGASGDERNVETELLRMLTRELRYLKCLTIACRSAARQRHQLAPSARRTRFVDGVTYPELQRAFRCAQWPLAQLCVHHPNVACLDAATSAFARTLASLTLSLFPDNTRRGVARGRDETAWFAAIASAFAELTALEEFELELQPYEPDEDEDEDEEEAVDERRTSSVLSRLGGGVVVWRSSTLRKIQLHRGADRAWPPLECRELREYRGRLEAEELSPLFRNSPRLDALSVRFADNSDDAHHQTRSNARLAAALAAIGRRRMQCLNFGNLSLQPATLVEIGARLGGALEALRITAAIGQTHAFDRALGELMRANRRTLDVLTVWRGTPCAADRNLIPTSSPPPSSSSSSSRSPSFFASSSSFDDQTAAPSPSSASSVSVRGTMSHLGKEAEETRVDIGGGGGGGGGDDDGCIVMESLRHLYLRHSRDFRLLSRLRCARLQTLDLWPPPSSSPTTTTTTTTTRDRPLTGADAAPVVSLPQLANFATLESVSIRQTDGTDASAFDSDHVSLYQVLAGNSSEPDATGADNDKSGSSSSDGISAMASKAPFCANTSDRHSVQCVAAAASEFRLTLRLLENRSGLAHLLAALPRVTTLELSVDAAPAHTDDTVLALTRVYVAASRHLQHVTYLDVGAMRAVDTSERVGEALIDIVRVLPSLTKVRVPIGARQSVMDAVHATLSRNNSRAVLWS